MPTGRIFDIQRFSIHDGPGIRTTVFLKGCPLRCLWCGNPESISLKSVVSYLPERCIGSGACVPVCESGALTRDAAGKALLDRVRCTLCGACAQVCDSKALEIVGRDATGAEIMAVVLRDKPFYQASKFMNADDPYQDYAIFTSGDGVKMTFKEFASIDLDKMAVRGVDDGDLLFFDIPHFSDGGEMYYKADGGNIKIYSVK